MILDELSKLAVARIEVVLKAQSEAVLPALIGSALRGAFGHALKSISCSVQHRDCEKCFLTDVCLYPTVFEPTSAKLSIPRPFVFEPPVPPLSRELGANEVLKLRVDAGGRIAFGLVLVGESASKLPYFVYAFELMARHGLGFDRNAFSVAEVSQFLPDGSKIRLYDTTMKKMAAAEKNDLGQFVSGRLAGMSVSKRLRIDLRTPLRVRRKKELIEHLNFAEIFKQCSLRFKLLAQNYGTAPEYDYIGLTERSKAVETIADNTWRYSMTRHSSRQGAKLELDGLLGDYEFSADDFSELLPLLAAGEILNIGSAPSLGLGKFAIA